MCTAYLGGALDGELAHVDGLSTEVVIDVAYIVIDNRCGVSNTLIGVCGCGLGVGARLQDFPLEELKVLAQDLNSEAI